MHPNEYRLIERTPNGLEATPFYAHVLTFAAEQAGPAYVEALEAQRQRQLSVLGA